MVQLPIQRIILSAYKNILITLTLSYLEPIYKKQDEYGSKHNERMQSSNKQYTNNIAIIGSWRLHPLIYWRMSNILIEFISMKQNYIDR